MIEEQNIEELKAQLAKLLKENAELKTKALEGVLQVCSSCKSVKSPNGHWLSLDRFIELYTKATCSHGYCEECADRILQAELGQEELND
ncbi:MAG: hypothetical protein LBV23_12035 [Deltaproteobacteria bacterium]|jgi:hypothetical protein|nr:hypothetical protein [Deltaproteobacteria bacterium]